MVYPLSLREVVLDLKKVRERETERQRDREDSEREIERELVSFY